MCFTKRSSRNESKIPNIVQHDPVAIKHYNEHYSPLDCKTCFSIELYTDKLDIAIRKYNSISRDPFSGESKDEVKNLYELPLEDLYNIAGKMPWDRDMKINQIADFYSQEYQKNKKNVVTFCSFCYNKALKESEKNGETLDMFGENCPWRSHNIKNAKGIVTCPFLRNLSCSNCGATGDNAHTKKYCPHPILVMKN
uniref:Nanos-type domain-containing protein n=1 Tax=Strongyloides venezuelensis TaxID=75913 RepID=A0A0K0FVG5_STRVS